MAAITASAFGLVKYNTIAFAITLQSASDTQANADLITTSGFNALAANGADPSVNGALPGASKVLYNFLNGLLFANDAGAETAWLNIGGEFIVRQLSGTATTVIAPTWKASPGNKPSLLWSGGADQVLQVLIKVPISNIQ